MATRRAGGLTLDDGAGTATIVLEHAATVLLAERRNYYYDIKTIQADGSSKLICTGTLHVVLTPTKRTT